jgi:hypothetical protein
VGSRPLPLGTNDALQPGVTRLLRVGERDARVDAEAVRGRVGTREDAV